MLQIIDLENKELLTQVHSEESANVNGGDAVAAATMLAAFLTANGAAFLTPAQAIIVIAVALV